MKKLCCIMMSFLLLLSGCGQTTTSVEPENTTELTAENNAAEQADENIQTEAAKESTPVDDTETKYQELIAKYKGTPYSEPQELGYIPQPRQSYSYVFYDTVKEIEEIGHLTDGWDDGTYVIVHFTNEENDLLMYDKSKLAGKEWSPYISAEFEEYMNTRDQLTENYSHANVRKGDTIPEIGSSNIYYKSAPVVNVIDTDVIYNGYHYYEIDNGKGLKNLVYVSLNCIPSPAYELYELGEYRDNVYYNEEYQIKVESDRIDIQNSNAGKKCGVYTNWVYAMDAVNWHEEFTVDTENGYTYLSIDTYEFPRTVSEADYNSIIEGLCEYKGDCLEQSTDIIGGKEYTRKSFSNEIIWHRYEGNKVYSITSGLPSLEESLELISDYNE